MFRFMRKPILRMFTGLTGLVFVTGQAFATEYTVALNKTQIMHLPSPASAIVVGNPEIADISVHSPDTLFIVGRGYGETNVIILDEFGQTVVEADIKVTEGISRNGVHLYKVGKGRETYTCSPQFCLQAPILGDTPKYIDTYSVGGGSSISNTSITPSLSSPPVQVDPNSSALLTGASAPFNPRN